MMPGDDRISSMQEYVERCRARAESEGVAVIAPDEFWERFSIASYSPAEAVLFVKEHGGQFSDEDFEADFRERKPEFYNAIANIFLEGRIIALRNAEKSASEAGDEAAVKALAAERNRIAALRRPGTPVCQRRPEC